MSGILLAALGASSMTARLHAQPTAGLRVHYGFEGNADDASGNGLHGTPQGPYSFVEGVRGQAVYLVGTAQAGDGGGHVLLPSLGLGAQSAVTLALWVREDVMEHPHGEGYLFFGDHGQGWCGIGHFGDLHYTVGGQVPSNLDTIALPFDEASSRRQWIHYALVYENGVQRAYRNGILVGTASGTIKIANDRAGIGIHWFYESSCWTRFTGAVDEVYVYERALPTSEIQELYRSSINDGMVAYLPMGGDASDRSPVGVGGVISGGVTFTPGPQGQAAHFNGVDGAIEIPAHTSRGFGTHPFSVSFMFRTTDQDYGYLVDARASGPEQGYTLAIHTSGPGLVWTAQDDGHYYMNGGPQVGPRTNSYQDGQWHVAVGVREQASISMYLDGALVGQTNIPPDLDVGPAFPIQLGRRFCCNSGPEFYSGDLDELRIYNRALRPFEVEALMSKPSVFDLRMYAGMTLEGPVGTTYRIECQNAVGGGDTWQRLATVTLSSTPMPWIDLDSPNQPKRFYRAVLGP